MIQYTSVLQCNQRASPGRGYVQAVHTSLMTAAHHGHELFKVYLPVPIRIDLAHCHSCFEAAELLALGLKCCESSKELLEAHSRMEAPVRLARLVVHSLACGVSLLPGLRLRGNCWAVWAKLVPGHNSRFGWLG
eukprot:5640949-Amphidinium_carterae.2